MSLFIDGLAFLYMLFNGVLGYSRGLVDELGRLIGLASSIIIAIGQTGRTSKIILEKIHLEPWLVTIIAFGSIFSIILILFRLITRLFKIALLSNANIGMNNILGFLFGMLKGYCIITVFIFYSLLIS